MENKTDIEKAREYFTDEYRVLIDNFGMEKHPEKITAVAIAITAIEKFIPKEPISDGLADRYCPACGKWIKFDGWNGKNAPKHCSECGQTFNWKGVIE